jgi:hypothetical protein
VLCDVQAECCQALEIKLLAFERRGFKDYLVLVIMLQTVWVFSITAVRGPAAGFYISDLPWLRTDYPEKSSGMESARADLEIIRLKDQTTFLRPIFIKPGYYVLEVH